MKNLMFVISSLFALQTFAIEVNDARLDGNGKNILVTVSHPGGCGTHRYALKLGVCLERLPRKCRAEIIHRTNDTCEGFMTQTVAFSLKQYKLDTPSFAGATIMIFGTPNENGEQSSARVVLP